MINVLQYMKCYVKFMLQNSNIGGVRGNFQCQGSGKASWKIMTQLRPAYMCSLSYEYVIHNYFKLSSLYYKIKRTKKSEVSLKYTVHNVSTFECVMGMKDFQYEKHNSTKSKRKNQPKFDWLPCFQTLLVLLLDYKDFFF